MTPAFGYVRCSGIGQMAGDGPERQRLAIEEFARRNFMQIEDWYVESHTGTDLDGRPEFREMRAKLVSNGVRTVIVERLDRLARDILIQETILADFKNNGIELKSATAGEDDLCGTDPTRTLIRQILGIFAQYERSMIVSKLLAARARKRATGERAEGVLPFGSKLGEDEALRYMLTHAKAGASPSHIAVNLNHVGFKTRHGKRWHSATVSKILKRQREFNGKK